MRDFMYANDEEICRFILVYRFWIRADLGFEVTDDQAIRGLLTLGAGKVPNQYFRKLEEQE